MASKEPSCTQQAPGGKESQDVDAAPIDDGRDESACDVTPVFDDDFIRARRARNKTSKPAGPADDDSLPADGLTEPILLGAVTSSPWRTRPCAFPTACWAIATSCAIRVP